MGWPLPPEWRKDGGEHVATFGENHPGEAVRRRVQFLSGTYQKCASRCGQGRVFSAQRFSRHAPHKAVQSAMLIKGAELLCDVYDNTRQGSVCQTDSELIQNALRRSVPAGAFLAPDIWPTLGLL